jgi:hypothetical protein
VTSYRDRASDILNALHRTHARAELALQEAHIQQARSAPSRSVILCRRLCLAMTRRQEPDGPYWMV